MIVIIMIIIIIIIIKRGNSVGDLSADVAMARKALSHIIIVNDSNNNKIKNIKRGNSVGDLSTDVAMARKALSHIIIVNDSNNNDNNNNKKGQLGRRPLHRRRHGPQGAFSYYYC